MSDTVQKLRETVKRYEADYNRYRQPEVMLGFKASLFDGIVDVFTNHVIDPAKASFVVGRVFQVVEPYAKAMTAIAEYEKAADKLAIIEKAAANIQAADSSV